MSDPKTASEIVHDMNETREESRKDAEWLEEIKEEIAERQEDSDDEEID